MPLNPNGKIDKPALPFPDTAQAASVDRRRGSVSSHKGDSTQEVMRSLWASILPTSPSIIPLDESFFDLGGHSILATRLIFEIRKIFLVEAPLGLVFDQPTISGLAAAIDALRDADLGLAYQNSVSRVETNGSAVPTGELNKSSSVALVEYGKDYEDLLPRLKVSYPPLPPDFADRPLTVFLTGATGFLGSFVLRDLLRWQGRVKKVICLVRAPDSQKALTRLREGAIDRGVWDEEWIKTQRLEVVIGDLSQDSFGLESDTWTRIAGEADAVLHNGALVRNLVRLNKELADLWNFTGPLGVSI
jgi:L-aminoadipate-semialdehyde dehydrogenase